MNTSKFSKPKATQAEIERVIKGANAVDDRPEKKPIDQGEVRFTMTMPRDLIGRVDRARKAAGV